MEGDEIKIRILYQHSKGKIFFCIGTAEDIDKTTKVILCLVETGKIFIRPIEMFKGTNPDFKPVMPT